MQSSKNSRNRRVEWYSWRQIDRRLTWSRWLSRQMPLGRGRSEGPMLVLSSNTTLPKCVTAVCIDAIPAFRTTTSQDPPPAATTNCRPGELYCHSADCATSTRNMLNKIRSTRPETLHNPMNNIILATLTSVTTRTCKQQTGSSTHFWISLDCLSWSSSWKFPKTKAKKKNVI